MGKGGSVDGILVPKDEGTRPLNNVKQEQIHLAKLAANDPDKRFHKLYRLVCQPEWLNKALDAIRANKGLNTPGTDGVRGEDLDQDRIEQLAEKLRMGTYQPTPVRRVYIPKRTGKLRPLGLPSAEDKVVQSAIKLILEPLYECVFQDCSHGCASRTKLSNGASCLYAKWDPYLDH